MGRRRGARLRCGGGGCRRGRRRERCLGVLDGKEGYRRFRKGVLRLERLASGKRGVL